MATVVMVAISMLFDSIVATIARAMQANWEELRCIDANKKRKLPHLARPVTWPK